MSSVFSNIYEMIILKQIEEIFKFNNKQFGYKANTSCEHASFIINEAISYYKKSGSPRYVISLDMKKAFDKIWRNGLFSKLTFYITINKSQRKLICSKSLLFHMSNESKFY